jgi:sugar lactone lactonase YvrE
VVCASSISFSPDGRALYFADSFQRAIWVYDYDIPSGIPNKRRIFADLRGQPGMPNGSTVDAEGCYWNAQRDGQRIVRYAPDGRVDRVIELPAVRPTCLAFGGADLTTLYVTTARWWLSADELAAVPLAGGVFALQPGVQGLPEPKFAG